jgi:hypothetical protein
MDPMVFGHQHYMDYQRRLRRAAARERLSLEEQGARGLLDDQPMPRRRESIRVSIGRWMAWVGSLAHRWEASA